MAWQIHHFATDTELVENLVPAIVHTLATAIATRGDGTLVVSGGNTPKRLFQHLSGADLDWSKVMVTLVDERWVPVDHADSNARLVRENLLQHRAAAASFTGLTNDAATPFDAEVAIDARLATMPARDVVILGMGGDGHTASFFPGAATLHQALFPNDGRRCRAIRPPTAPHPRMTLTLPAILDCEHLLLHIVGDDKLRVLEQAMQAGAVEDLPVRAVLHQTQTPLEIYYAASAE